MQLNNAQPYVLCGLYGIPARGVCAMVHGKSGTVACGSEPSSPALIGELSWVFATDVFPYSAFHPIDTLRFHAHL